MNSAKSAATTGVPREESGLASGLLSTAQQIGGSIGLAILSSVASAHAATVLSSLPADGTAQTYALVEGFHAAFYTGLAFALLAALIAFVFVKPLRPSADAPAFIPVD